VGRDRSTEIDLKKVSAKMDSTNESGAGTSSDVYAGQVAKTRQELIHFTCEKCGHLFGAMVHRAVDAATSPELRELLLLGRINQIACTRCGETTTVSVPMLYHDPGVRRLAYVLPEGMRHRELEMRIHLLEMLSGDPADLPPYVRAANVVFGAAGLAAFLAEPAPGAAVPGQDAAREEADEKRRAELDGREAEIVAREEDLQAKQEDLVARSAKLEKERHELASKWDEVEREREALRALSLELQSRETAQRERQKVHAHEQERIEEELELLDASLLREEASDPGIELDTKKISKVDRGEGGIETRKIELSVLRSKVAKMSPALGTKAPADGAAVAAPASPLHPEAEGAAVVAASTAGEEPAAPAPAGGGGAEGSTPAPEAATAQGEPASPSDAKVAPAPEGAAPESGPAPAEPPPPEARPQAEVDRFRAGEERTGHILHEGAVFLLARPPAAGLDALRRADLSVMVQLHRFPASPLIDLAIVPSAVEAEAKTPSALFFVFDPAAEADRVLLSKLAEKCAFHLDLFDEESRPTASRRVHAPLEENVRHLLARAVEALEAIAPEARSFPEASRAFGEMGVDDRLGRKQHNFSSESFLELPSPAAARLALGILSYWSEPENEDYLLLLKSFPLGYWRAIEERVVRRAIDFGLRLPPALVDFALAQRLSSSKEELLRSLLSSFAEVSLRLKPSDLDPIQEWENWKLLLADSVELGVQVDPEIEELAASAGKKVGPVEDEGVAGGDLTVLPEDQLLALLGDRDLRRDAALEVCDRRIVSALGAVMNAVCNMTRSEVARVLPSMVQLGADAIPFFSKGLRHRKSFLRQGCALALGQARAVEALEPLMDMLLSEPTNIWKEAARAIGDVGPRALGALIAGVRLADGEGRERIAWALAQSALDAQSLGEVEAMAEGRDPLLAKVAKRALDILDDVRHNDLEVRGGKPMKEQTIVRAFSKRFFESMSGEAAAAPERHVIEQEEVLGDMDIIEEEVVVEDDDILEPNRP
jgi:hypothetical protein